LPAWCSIETLLKSFFAISHTPALTWQRLIDTLRKKDSATG